MAAQMKPVNSSRIGVIGAGTMGSGIALAALLAGLRVILYDVDLGVIEKAKDYIESHLHKKQRAINIKYLNTTQNLEDISGCGYVIEAAPEKLPLKQDLFAKLDKICPPPAILATNTSTLAVTAIASACREPARVGGMHFFNPAPVMPLVEVISGAATHPDTVKALTDLAEKMGKTPVVARDTPGFIVNRVARPFYGEALRIVGEGAATFEQVDRVVREGAGFRMGPFELMDLIGIDVNFSATQSMYEQSFGEPRYRPHLLQAQMVQQKALGRKTGKGFYTYEGEKEKGKESRTGTSKKMDTQGKTVYFSPGIWAPGLQTLLSESGHSIIESIEAGVAVDAAIVCLGREEGLFEHLEQAEARLSPEVPLLVQAADTALSEIENRLLYPERLAGFDGLFAASGAVVTLAAGADLNLEVKRTVEELFSSAGKQPEWVKESPGLILPRIISMLVNEAAFAAGEGSADQGTIDKAMKLGTNYPKGPFEWAVNLGYDKVVNMLDHLRAEYGEERYRAAPLLRRWARRKIIDLKDDI
jgi:3-hydroxybutyryl-CoA dehydrogenase